MSYQKLVLISPVLLLMVVESSWALSCISCYIVTCPEEPQCAGGKVLDPCGCCYKCAKQRNESCGGVYGFEGSCDLGLKCERTDNFGMTIGVCKVVPRVWVQRLRPLYGLLLLDFMMYPRLMLISQALLLLLVVESSWALSCMYCSRLSCPEVLQCPGGKVLEPCGCCYECAKQKGEICGGPFDEFGTCDEGLQCVRHRRQVYSDGVCKATPLFNRVTRPEERVAEVLLYLRSLPQLSTHIFLFPDLEQYIPLGYPHTVPADGAVGVEVERHQAFWTCDTKPFILVLTTVPPPTDSLVVSIKTKAVLVTEDDPLPFWSCVVQPPANGAALTGRLMEESLLTEYPQSWLLGQSGVRHVRLYIYFREPHYLISKAGGRTSPATTNTPVEHLDDVGALWFLTSIHHGVEVALDTSDLYIPEVLPTDHHYQH
ncbi:hypothetical protein NFI96_005673 [Prochilodus magdalenae]|nr:hypothetical protein NFI96_005673 [Prochilodus magdalenae]